MKLLSDDFLDRLSDQIETPRERFVRLDQHVHQLVICVGAHFFGIRFRLTAYKRRFFFGSGDDMVFA